MTSRHVTVGDITLGNDLPLVLIAGPCALESRGHALEVSAALVEITRKLGIALIYKTSFDKANRTSLDGVRGVGIEDGLPIPAEIRESRGIPVVFDATHSVQQPGGQGGKSGGDRRFVEILARAAVAVGVAAVFMETHEDPDRAPSDGPNMVPLKALPAILETLIAFDKLAK